MISRVQMSQTFVYHTGVWGFIFLGKYFIYRIYAGYLKVVWDFYAYLLW